MNRKGPLVSRVIGWAGKHPTKTLILIALLLTGLAGLIWRALNAIGWTVSFGLTLLLTAIATVILLVVAIIAILCQWDKDQRQSP